MRLLSRLAALALILPAAYPQARAPAPRSDVSDYPVHAAANGIAIGAVLLNATQVHQRFSPDLDRYVVIEVAVYPPGGGDLDLGPGDFWLQAGGEVLRPVAPRAIAGALVRNPAKDVSIYPTAGVGYSRGPYGGGWGTGVGVGVGVAEQRPAPEDRKAAETQLGERQLPEKLVSQPVAGYLYFPAPKDKTRAGWQLEYKSPAGSALLKLPAPKK